MDRPQSLWLKFERSGKLTDYINFCEERRRMKSRREPDGSDDPPADQSSL